MNIFIGRNASSQLVNFGAVQLSLYKDSSAIATNSLPTSLNVTATYMKHSPSDYTILSGGAPFLLPPGGTHKFKMRFAPSELGVRDDSIVIVGSFPGSPLYLHLTGNGIPLPVELQVFTAWRNESGILLQWTTASETNNFGFEIQRRDADQSIADQECSSFLKIGFVEGSGTSHDEHRYSYFDSDETILNENDPRTFPEYRLKQVDLDGTVSYSPIVRVNRPPDAIQLTQIEMYPNPFSTNLKIRWNSPNAVLKIYDELGRELMNLSDQLRDYRTLNAIHQNSVQLTNMDFPKAGMYFLTCRTDKEIQVKPIVYLK